MSQIYRLLHAERGVALMTVMVAIFILTIVVGAMAIATMGETSLSYDQLRGQQAVAVAEAGAYRALAELRRRLHVDLDAQVRRGPPFVTPLIMDDICTDIPLVLMDQIDIITSYAYPTSLGATDWVKTGIGPIATGTLNIGTSGSRILMTDSVTGATIGDFYAQIIVRSSGAAPTCNSGATVPDQFVMWFDYAIVSVARSGNATRSVCLRNTGADRCADWLPSANPADWTGSTNGWPVLVEQAAYSQWALMLLNVGTVWMYTGAQIFGPVHANNQIRIAGDPTFFDVITQVNTDMRFLNCGSQNNITIPASNPNPTLRTACDNTLWNTPTPSFRSTVTGGVPAIPPPTSANPSRTSVGLSPSGPPATPTEVADRTTDLADGLPSIPDGLYVMDQCASPPCGGIYVKGDVSQMVLTSESGEQVIYVTVPTPGDPNNPKQNMRIVINPTTGAITTYWGLGWSNSQTYPGAIFNGVFYVNGSICATSSCTPPVSGSSGLYGIVNRLMRLTIATEGELRITDHLVYENPPAGPGHNPVNVLGLYSVTSNVTMVGTVTPDDLYIDAAVLSPAGRFWVEDWNTIPLKGNVYFLGGTVQGTFGAFGGFTPDTGYGRVMTYDWRLRSNVSPPFFPQTDIYTAIRWPSPAAVFVPGDPLYDRPQWEELVGL